jgi:NADH-quinone oxidoreductase subunit E
MKATELDQMVQKHGGDDSALIAVLQDIQRQEGYLDREMLILLSEKLKVPLSRIYALATFYRSFSLTPTGRHRVSVCLGTACHVRGGQAVLDQLGRELGVAAGGTTADREFTLETVRCLGCCSIGPVVKVDQETFGRIRQDKVGKVLRKFQ